MPPDLLAALRQFWGYSTFRFKQEAIIRAILDQRDTCVVMPTGGGKSLCYQLPAVVMGGTALVVSPLIALMKDQVASLTSNGIRAAFLNSTLPPEHQRRILREASQGKYQLLYLSPERLARPDSLSWLHQLPLSFFVIDEAHCISEWGHEFRPEYRQLSALRTHFPDLPVAAFTASATQRVRHDILQQLRMRDPAKFIVSFHRPNLRYIVREVDAREQQRLMLAALHHFKHESVIIYAPTIQTVNETIDLLRAKRFNAVPYHGQMDTQSRERNQERFMSDEVRIVVGTLAFGLGINKPSVRAVIHLALPKSLEQYYQEAGRAGRDSEPADCLLLWRRRDAGLLVHFIQQIQDPHEKRNAWDRYREIRSFAETPACRHLTICRHFGEIPKWERCGQCDICGNHPDYWDAAANPAVETQPAAAATRQPAAPQPVSSAADAALLDHLREWRRQKARSLKIASFLILHDASLQDLARKRPRNRDELLTVQGVGLRKLDQFGDEILDAIASFSSPGTGTSGTQPDVTLDLLRSGARFTDIAALTGRSEAQVVASACAAIEAGHITISPIWLPPEIEALIRDAASAVGFDSLKRIQDRLPGISIHFIRLALSKWKQENAQ
jgi:ATP-dependent DNA helicase RecQ